LYLGIDTDQHLFGERTVNTIIKKVSSRLRYKHRKANCLSDEIRKTVGIVLMQCHFDYSCSSWYSGIFHVFENKNKLQVVQNKTKTFIKSMGQGTNIKQMYLFSLGYVNVDNRVKQLRLNHC